MHIASLDKSIVRHSASSQLETLLKLIYLIGAFYVGIGVPRQAGKPRSNSAISALSADEFDATPHTADGAAEVTADMASLAFTQTATC